MSEQPALTTSTGTVWLVVGACFALASLVPLCLLIFVSRGPSTPVAGATAVAVLVLYLAMLVTRFVSGPGRTRLRILAACMLTMAALALVGVLVCLVIEAAPR